jgi:hypothetical protein
VVTGGFGSPSPATTQRNLPSQHCNTPHIPSRLSPLQLAVHQLLLLAGPAPASKATCILGTAAVDAHDMPAHQLRSSAESQHWPDDRHNTERPLPTACMHGTPVLVQLAACIRCHTPSMCVPRTVPHMLQDAAAVSSVLYCMLSQAPEDNNLQPPTLLMQGLHPEIATVKPSRPPNLACDAAASLQLAPPAPHACEDVPHPGAFHTPPLHSHRWCVCKRTAHSNTPAT